MHTPDRKNGQRHEQSQKYIIMFLKYMKEFNIMLTNRRTNENELKYTISHP